MRTENKNRNKFDLGASVFICDNIGITSATITSIRYSDVDDRTIIYSFNFNTAPHLERKEEYVKQTKEEWINN